MTLEPASFAVKENRGDAAVFAQRRGAIDTFARLRTRSARIGLFASLLLRPHPIRPDQDDQRQAWRGILLEQVERFKAARDLLRGRVEDERFSEMVRNWIVQHGKHQTDFAKSLDRAIFHACAVADALDKSTPELDAAIQAQFHFGREIFFDAVTEFCALLWDDVDLRRRADVERAQAASSTIADTLVRLEQIGKHVRLVSLNASVEAARVGENGRGLAVIAQEFKNLAEEIQKLARDANGELGSLVVREGTHAENDALDEVKIA